VRASAMESLLDQEVKVLPQIYTTGSVSRP
jgi:hypothetical protein